MNLKVRKIAHKKGIRTQGAICCQGSTLVGKISQSPQTSEISLRSMLAI